MSAIPSSTHIIQWGKGTHMSPNLFRLLAACRPPYQFHLADDVDGVIHSVEHDASNIVLINEIVPARELEKIRTFVHQRRDTDIRFVYSDQPNFPTESAAPHPVLRQTASLSQDVAGVDWHTVSSRVEHSLRTAAGIIQGYSELMVNGEFGDLSPSQQIAAGVIWQKNAQLWETLEMVSGLVRVLCDNVAWVPVNFHDLFERLVIDFPHLAVHWPLRLPAPAKHQELKFTGDPELLRLAFGGLFRLLTSGVAPAGNPHALDLKIDILPNNILEIILETPSEPAPLSSHLDSLEFLTARLIFTTHNASINPSAHRRHPTRFIIRFDR